MSAFLAIILSLVVLPQVLGFDETSHTVLRC